jgi:flagellar basal-body rod protein FlgF
MDPITSILATALVRDGQRMQIIGRNFVGASLAGHRAEIPIMSAFAPMLDVLVTAPPAITVGSALDARQGTLKRTGRELDVALEGPGHFMVRNGDALEPTRNGSFSLNATGMLVDGRGRPVTGPSGEWIVIGAGQAEIDAEGFVSVLEETVGRIGVFQNDTLLGAEDGVQLRQGFLESSNVDVTDQMVRVMETTRHFGLAARALRAYDGMLEAAIEQAAEF